MSTAIVQIAPDDAIPEPIVYRSEEEALEASYALHVAYLEEERRGLGIRDSAESQPTATYLTKPALAASVGISERTLDKLLRQPGVVATLGAWRTSPGRNAHWRFPLDAPNALRTFLAPRSH